jgi:hypothetical protein
MHNIIKTLPMLLIDINWLDSIWCSDANTHQVLILSKGLPADSIVASPVLASSSGGRG